MPVSGLSWSSFIVRIAILPHVGKEAIVTIAVYELLSFNITVISVIVKHRKEVNNRSYHLKHIYRNRIKARQSSFNWSKAENCRQASGERSTGVVDFESKEVPHMSQSEVAQLRQSILEEYEAMKRGLTGFAWGSAKHAFIDARMKRVDYYHEQLVKQVGEQEATHTICALYEQVIG
jgi:uncharacterized protein YifN (PemK superfamily)